MVLHASSSLGGEGVQECRYAWGGHDAAEQDGGASGVGYSLAVPYSYPLDYPETHNPLAYFAALRRERGGGEWWDQLPTRGREAPWRGHGKDGLEPKVTVGSRARECICRCGIQAHAWTHNDGNRDDSQVKKTPNEPKSILPPPNTELWEIKPLSAFMGRNIYDGDVFNLEACWRQSQPDDDYSHTGWRHQAGEALQWLSGGLHPPWPGSSYSPLSPSL